MKEHHRTSRDRIEPEPQPGAAREEDRDTIDPEDEVEEASFESFPASDPPSFTPSRVGKPTEEPPPDRAR